MHHWTQITVIFIHNWTVCVVAAVMSAKYCYLHTLILIILTTLLWYPKTIQPVHFLYSFMTLQTSRPAGTSLIRLNYHVAICQKKFQRACMQHVTKDWLKRDLWVHCLYSKEMSSKRCDIRLLCISGMCMIMKLGTKIFPSYLQLMQSLITELWFVHCLMQTLY